MKLQELRTATRKKLEEIKNIDSHRIFQRKTMRIFDPYPHSDIIHYCEEFIKQDINYLNNFYPCDIISEINKYFIKFPEAIGLSLSYIPSQYQEPYMTVLFPNSKGGYTVTVSYDFVGLITQIENEITGNESTQEFLSKLKIWNTHDFLKSFWRKIEKFMGNQLIEQAFRL